MKKKTKGKRKTRKITEKESNARMKAILKINDKEIEVEVSEEQIEKLTEKKKSPFARVAVGESYYYINPNNKIVCTLEEEIEADDLIYSVANYCTDKDLIQQQALRETLNRLLWRWQYENDEPVDWCNFDKAKHCIIYDHNFRRFVLGHNDLYKSQGAVYFTTEEKAEQAIEAVVKPFMQEHPDFVW